ncbi:hypothetical protein BM221_000785 [Beauveria bassiana]|uniref:DUF7600 domain-containing protein n=1 Tax=Beauveria bassiana TaxID=176275 RepID=A0A2N6P1I5_BEABA|nr:hypothetical protein BM221_000785 [Beauveria bassiana]
MSESDDDLHVPVMCQEAIDGLHGFVLHSACWDLLNKACKPVGPSLERLLSICESLPFPMWYNGVSWGHDYEGLLEPNPGRTYPWMERFSPPSIASTFETGAMSDPNDVSVLRTMLPTATSHFTTMTRPLAKDADPFFRVPWEICEMILASIQTRDALNLRLASPSFLPLFSSLSFWLSRFEPDGERGFIFEVEEERGNWGVDALLKIHHSSKRSLGTSAITNRKRTWNLARRLASLMETPTMSNNSSEQTFDSWEWVEITGSEHIIDPALPWEKFQAGCRSTTRTVVNVPPDITKIGITIVNAGVWNYVTGIRIIGRDGNEHAAGYVSKDKDVLCHLSQLHGLRVAMGPGGVRALQVVAEGQQVSKWIGNIERVPQSDRLVVGAPITSLSVTLDGYKVTGLSVDSSQAQPTSIRRTALWYPSVPPDCLLLNQNSFTDQDPLSAGYQPLSWIQFGGEAGKSLKHVQGLVVQFSYCLHGLQFMYNESHGTQYSDKLGRCTERKLRDTFFSIDGAGGERIDLIHVGLREMDEDSPDSVVPGTVQYLEDAAYGYGLVSLGAIAERIVDPI